MTKEEKCPTCGGPAIDRSEYWETCWTPNPPIPDNLRATAWERSNRKREEIAAEIAEYDAYIADGGLTRSQWRNEKQALLNWFDFMLGPKEAP